MTHESPSGPDTMPSGPDEPRETATSRRLLAAISLVACGVFGVLVTLQSSCGRESPPGTTRAAAGAPEAPPAPTPVPTPDAGEPVSIRDTAQAGEAPFAAARSPFLAKTDDKGRVWVLDSENCRLRLFDRDGGFLGGWGGHGSGQFAFNSPEGLAISGDDVYVADTWNHRVIHYSLSGAWKGNVQNFMGPRGIAVAPDRSVWITDTGNHRVMRYDPMLQKGEIMAGQGKEPGKFEGPVGIAFGPSGNVYVTDPGNKRIQVLDRNGKFVKAWELPWLEKSWQARLESDARETLYVSNPASGEVVALDRSGSPAKTWKELSDQKLQLPVGLGIDRKRGVLYVTDIASHKVLRVGLSP